jgi:hypothetical protein
LASKVRIGLDRLADRGIPQDLKLGEAVMFKAARNWAAIIAPIVFIGCGTTSPSRDDSANISDGQLIRPNTHLNEGDPNGSSGGQNRTSGGGPYFSYERFNGKMGQ